MLFIRWQTLCKKNQTTMEKDCYFYKYNDVDIAIMDLDLKKIKNKKEM